MRDATHDCDDLSEFSYDFQEFQDSVLYTTIRPAPYLVKYRLLSESENESEHFSRLFANILNYRK